MSLPVILRPEAEQDLEAARDYYDEQAGLGQAFVDRVSEVLDRIGDTPRLYAVIWKTVRSCQTRRFPYVIYYRVRTDFVEVLAVLHGRRNPTAWKRRV